MCTWIKYDTICKKLFRNVKGKNVGTYDTLNDVLVNLFRDINSIEEKAIASQEYQDLTNNDMHVINAIGIGTTKNMSSIAKELSVTVGTLTISMNSLVKKGYVIRCRSTQDRRVVHISLSEKGVKAYYHHKHFHEQMIQGVVGVLTEEELQALIKALTKVKFLVQKLWRGRIRRQHYNEKMVIRSADSYDGSFTGCMYTDH